MSTSWRTDKRILVTESHATGSVAAIRSLGAAGYTVIAVSPRADALGFLSRFASRSLVHPPYHEQTAYLDWLAATVATEGIDLIVPSEAFLLAIRPVFERYQGLLAGATSPQQIYSGLSKYDLFKTCEDAGLTDHLPPYLLLDADRPLPSADALARLGSPLFIKVDAPHSRSGKEGGQVIRCTQVSDALARLATLYRDYRYVLVQGFVSGIGVGAFLARLDGQPLARFMHRRLHEVPHTGGASSFRASWHHAGVMADAETLMDALGWHGVGMFEYRWNPADDTFYLMEFNARFWGSLHLALFAGVDFPRLLADAFFGHPNPPVLTYRDTRCRLTFPRDLEYVLSCLKDKALPPSRRFWPVAEFFLLGLDPRVCSDMNFPGDRRLYLHAMWRTVGKFLQ